MRRFALTVVALSCGLLLVACGGDDKKPDGGTLPPDIGNKKDGIKKDGPTVTLREAGKDVVRKPDGKAQTACDPTIIGKPCTENPGGECGENHTCLLTSDTPGVADSGKGFCTCDCTPDDGATPLVNEDNCPDLTKGICGSVSLTDGTTKDFCLKTCAPKLGASDCQSPLACDPRSGPSFGIFDKAVCAFPGCTKGEDCPVITSAVCSVSAKNCPTGQTCLTYAGGDDGRCTLAGKCDTASGLCADHTLGKAGAVVGGVCKDDTECAGNMKCMAEFDQAKSLGHENATCTDGSGCCSGECTAGKCTKGLCTLLYRNGYCVITGCSFAKTLTSRACPTGSDCNNLYTGGMCQKSCDPKVAADCRNNANDYLGDYECRVWSNISLGGVAASNGPVCDFGVQIPCNIFANSQLDCSYMGIMDPPPANSTNMKCRTLDNKDTTDKYDPNGFCLDDTSSGSKMRTNPLP
jgi:hypothetical protein